MPSVPTSGEGSLSRRGSTWITHSSSGKQSESMAQGAVMQRARLTEHSSPAWHSPSMIHICWQMPRSQRPLGPGQSQSLRHLSTQREFWKSQVMSSGHSSERVQYFTVHLPHTQPSRPMQSASELQSSSDGASSFWQKPPSEPPGGAMRWVATQISRGPFSSNGATPVTIPTPEYTVWVSSVQEEAARASRRKNRLIF